MQSKILVKWPLFFVSILGITFFLIFLMVILFTGSPDRDFYVKPILPSSSQTLQANSELPIRLKIPTINVDAAIEYVGLTSDGTVDVPKNPANAAWFNMGSRPGENGSAVITGHYGPWENGEVSVFDNLYKLKKGDKLYVKDDKGIIIPFVVREKRSYDSDAIVPEVFNLNDGKSHLNLITCEGIWNKDSESYPKRLVVFADKE